jgi:prepilin-type N-terminal cleavage/methylation domain-containing protein
LLGDYGLDGQMHLISPWNSLFAGIVGRFLWANISETNARRQAEGGANMAGRLSAFPRGKKECRGHAFTLVELLIVIGIISVLIGLLLPTIVAARNQASAVACLSNIHVLGTGVIMFAQENGGNYPANTTSPSPGQAWWDVNQVGRMIALPAIYPGRSCIYSCPADGGAQLSYSMNIWTSSAVDKSVLQPKAPAVANGSLWLHRRRSSAVILLAESWSYLSGNWGYMSATTIGNRSSSAVKQFGAQGGVSPFLAGRWGTVNCELSYARHRKAKGQGSGTRPQGQLTICFDDGHAALCSNSDLVDAEGKSTGLAAWSPADFIRY